MAQDLCCPVFKRSSSDTAHSIKDLVHATKIVEFAWKHSWAEGGRGGEKAKRPMKSTHACVHVFMSA